jgi:hypothetical protein
MKNREDAIIRYVSDEMTPKEKIQFEQQMAEDASLREEVQELQATQEVLQSWPDTTFEVPSLADVQQEDPPKIARLRAVGMPRWMSYAAAVLLLLGFAWLSDLQVTQQDHALVLSFGPAEQSPSYSGEQVAQIVDQAMAKYTAQLQSEKTAEEQKADQQFTALEQKITSRLAALYQKDLQEVRQQLYDHERKQLLATEELVRGLQFEQRVLMQEAIVAVLERIEQQRLEDRIGLENAFEQITTLLTDIQNGGLMMEGVTDLEGRHY